MRTITGTVKHDDGSAWAAGLLKSRLMEAFTTATATYPCEEHVETLDADGYFAVDLATPDTGAAHYKITTPDGQPHYVYLETGPATDLQTVLALPGQAVSQEAAQTVMDAHENKVDTHRALLASDLMENTILAAMDQTIHNIEMGPYLLTYNLDGINGYTATTYPYGLTAPQAMTLVQWTQSYFVVTTNNPSNYWSIVISRVTGETVISLSTANSSADMWHPTINTTFDIAALVQGDNLYMSCIKQGNPGNLKLFTPILSFHSHIANP